METLQHAAWGKDSIVQKRNKNPETNENGNNNYYNFWGRAKVVGLKVNFIPINDNSKNRFQLNNYLMPCKVLENLKKS